MDISQSARDTDCVTHLSGGGSQRVCQNHWEAVSENIGPGPSMSHRISDWALGPQHTIVILASAQDRKEKAVSFGHTLDVGREPL